MHKHYIYGNQKNEVWAYKYPIVYEAIMTFGFMAFQFNVYKI